MEDVLVEVALGAVDESLACLADAAAQDNHLGVHGAADHGKELAHVLIDLVEGLVCQVIAGLGSVEYILAGQRIEGPQAGVSIAGGHKLLGDADNAGGGAILLGAAPLAAAALVGFVTVQGDVADFAAGAVDTVDNLATHDDAAADTGTQGGEDHVLAALAAALPGFAQRGHIGVIAGSDGQAGQTAQNFGNVDDTPA